MLGLWILVIAGVFILYIVVKALLFTPKKTAKSIADTININSERAVKKFQRIIQIPTVSHTDGIGEDEAVFTEFLNSLPELFPHVYNNLELEKVGRRGLLFHWKGKDSAQVSVFMAHYDVVPVNESEWSVEPFCGKLADGVLWGRGTLDTKGTFTATLETVESLLEEGFTPQNDVYLAFSGEEEPHGPSAEQMAEKIHSLGKEIKFVLDEGGAVIENIFTSGGNRIAVIGIGEKGVMDVRLTLSGEGGHASQPPAKSLIGKLCTAMKRIEKRPMQMHLNAPFSKLIDTVGRYAGFPLKLVLANLRIFKPVLNMLTKKKGGELNALIRSTFAFTMLKGSPQINVMPSTVEGGINVRCLKEDSKETILSHITKVAATENLKAEALFYEAASNYSRTDGEAYELLKQSINETWSDAVVSPYLMIAASDSRYYSKFSDKVYRFSAMEMTKAERKMIHGFDERIRISEWERTLQFYYRLIKRM